MPTMSDDVEIVDAEPVDGDAPVTDVATSAPVTRLTPVQRRIQKVAESIKDEVANAAVMGETADELKKRLDWARKTRPAAQVVWRRAAVLALSATGMMATEIADVVDVSAQTVRATLYDLRRAGLGVDVTDRLDHGLVPEAVAQLGKMIEAGDKEAVFAVLKGRGALRQHVAGEGQGRGPMTVLAVKCEMPPGMQPSLVGTVGGKPREDT